MLLLSKVAITCIKHLKMHSYFLLFTDHE